MAAEKNIGSIAVEILAKTEKLESGLQSASRKISVFGGIVAGIASSISTKFIEMGTGAVKGIASMVAQTLEQTQALNDLSMRVDTSIENLQSLGSAANKAGSSAETLNDSMDKFVKTLGNADESKDAQQALYMLGIRLEDLQANDKAAGLAEVAKQLSSITDVTQRAYIETTLFGKSGQQLDGLLRDLAERGLDGVRNAALETGEALNEIDNQKIVLAQGSVEQLKGVYEGLKNQIALQLAPAIDFVTGKVLEFIKANGGLGPIVSKAFGYMNHAIGWVVNSLHLLQAVWYGWQAAVNKFAQIVLASSPFSILSEQIDAMVVGFQKGINIMIDGWNSFQNLVAAGQAKYAAMMKARALNNGDKEGAAYYSQLQRLSEQDMKRNSMSHISVVNPGVTQMFTDIQSELQKNVDEGAKGFTEHLEAWLKGKGHDDWIEWTDEIGAAFTDRAADAAEAAIVNTKTFADKMVKEQKDTKVGFGTQLDNTRVSAEAMRAAASKVQKVEDPQLKKTNSLLTRIADKDGVLRAL